MIIYSASQSLIKTVSAGVRFFSVPAKAKAFLFKRKPGYKAHYRFTRTLISIALRNIQLFNMQLTAVSGRGIKNIATCQASNVIAAARTMPASGGFPHSPGQPGFHFPAGRASAPAPAGTPHCRRLHRRTAEAHPPGCGAAFSPAHRWQFQL